jgi:putative ABC transport system permease protein
MKQKMDYLTFVVASLRNKPGRNLATIFCFAFIAANIFSAQYLIAGAVGSVDLGVSRMGADILVAAPQYSGFYKYAGPENTAAIVKVESSTMRITTKDVEAAVKADGVEKASPQLYVATLNVPELSSSPVDIFGIDPATDFTIQAWLNRPLNHPLGPGEVLVGSAISGPVSSQISINDRHYTVAGRLDPTRTSVDTTIFLGMDDAYALTTVDGIVPTTVPRISPGDINGILIRVKPGADPAMVQARVKAPNAALTVIGKHFTLDPVSKDIKGLPNLLAAITAVVVLAAFPLIALIAAMVARERQREIGLLKSIGAKRNVVFFLVFVESLALAVIGGLAGIGASLGTFFMLNSQSVLDNALQVSFRMPTVVETGLMAGLAVTIVIVIGSLASLWPAYRSSQMNPYDAIRSEGQ